MMDKLLVLPILIPFLTAIFCLLTWKAVRLQRIVSLIGAAVLMITAIKLFSLVWGHGIQSTQMGNWPAPFGITLACDLLSAIMVIMTGIVGVAVMVYSITGIDKQRESFGYYPLLNILLMGVCGAFLTGDIFNLYVWFEVMLMTSFVLLELGGEKDQLEGAVKYVTLNLMSSALFLTGVAIVYGLSGSLNMAEISLILNKADASGLLNAVAMLFFLAFGIKAAAFPLFFWLPASYHTPPAPISAIFAGLLTKVGVYAMIRVFTLIFVQDTPYTHMIILICAAFTMVTGVFGAMAQDEFRRILSFHIVSQVGYMIMGLGLYTLLGLTGAVFYIMHHIIAKTNLFLISGVVYKLKGTYELKKLGGLYRDYPLLSLLFLTSAFALAGIPPLSGFWAKFVLIKAGLVISNYWIAGIALFVGLLTLYSMTKIWNEGFWKNAPVETEDNSNERFMEFGLSKYKEVWTMMLPVVVLAGMSVIIGLFADHFLTLAEKAASQLMDPSEYIQVVLKGGAS